MAERDEQGAILQRAVTRRQVLQVGVAGSAAAFLAACGAAATPAPATPAPATAAPATAAPATAAPATAAPASAGPTPAPTAQSFEGVTLNVFSGGTSFPPLDAVATEWEAETKGVVKREVIPGAERAIKFAGLIATQDPSVDILYGWTQFIGQFGDRLYEDLTAMGADVSDFVPAIVPAFTFGEGIRAIPEHSEMEIFIYNKRHFSDAGLDPERKDWSWDELFAAAPKLTQGNRYPCAVPWGGGAYYWLCMYNSIEGAELLTADRGQLLFDNENGLLAFRTLEAGLKAGFFDPAFYSGVDDYATGRVFNGGGTASQINFSELWAQAVSKNVADFGATIDPAEVGATIVPGITAGRSGTINGFEGFGVSRYSAHKDAGFSLVTKLGSKAFQEKMTTFNLPSSRVSVLNDPAQLAKFPVGSVLAEQGTHNLNRYPAPYNWAPPFNEAITKLIAGEFTAAQAHAFAVKGVQEVIVKYLSS